MRLSDAYDITPFPWFFQQIRSNSNDQDLLKNFCLVEKLNLNKTNDF